MSFKQNMLRGLGKCHIDILRSNNREIFREDKQSLGKEQVFDVRIYKYRTLSR